MSIFILTVKHTKHIFNYCIIGTINENRYFSFRQRHKDNTDRDNR